VLEFRLNSCDWNRVGRIAACLLLLSYLAYSSTLKNGGYIFLRNVVGLKITGFLDCGHRPVFYKLENTTFRKLDLFPSSREGRVIKVNTF
jgi:hypothetical protein